jgi:hypothetical protein
MGSAVSQESPRKSAGIDILSFYQDVGGIVQSQKMAINIAKAIIDGLYGEAVLKEQESFSATEKDGRWIVRGSHKDLGFDAVVVLSKSDASVSRIHVPARTEPEPDQVSEQ